MRPALLLFGYALAVAWWAPALLSRLTARGISPRLGLAAWLTAMASALASAAAALEFLVQAAVTGWSRLAEVVCRSVAGHACAQTVYTSAVFELTLAVITVVAALAAAAVAWRYGRGVQRAQRQTRAHAEVARITGRGLPGVTATVVLDSPQPIVYCVAGRPGMIVLTSGALALLEPAQLAAVLAHERARRLAAVFPAVPLFARGPENVARLAEMCADDDAARRGGRSTLLAALLAMATGAAVPASALGAMTCAVTARLQRLAEAPQRGRHTGNGLALTAVTLLLAGLPVLVAALAGAVALPGITS